MQQRLSRLPWAFLGPEGTQIGSQGVLGFRPGTCTEEFGVCFVTAKRPELGRITLGCECYQTLGGDDQGQPITGRRAPGGVGL